MRPSARPDYVEDESDVEISLTNWLRCRFAPCDWQILFQPCDAARAEWLRDTHQLVCVHAYLPDPRR